MPAELLDTETDPAAATASSSRTPRSPLRVAVAVVTVCALVVVAIAVARARAADNEAMAASERHQALVLSAFAGMEEAVNTYLDLPADQRDDALLTGGAHLGTEQSAYPGASYVRTEVLRTAPEVVTRLTVVSDGHTSTVWEKRAAGMSDTCSTSDAGPSPFDCEAWALLPLT